MLWYVHFDSLEILTQYNYNLSCRKIFIEMSPYVIKHMHFHSCCRLQNRCYNEYFWIYGVFLFPPYMCTHTHTHTHTHTQVGPGIVCLTFKSFLGGGLLLQTLTPQEPLVQKYTLTAYADWWIPKFLTRMMITGYDVQVGRGRSKDW